jgi:hypothetical protein
MSLLDKFGAAPYGMTWGSVPLLWPVNFPFGWGPPLGPSGMAAYSAPLLSGEKKKKKARDNKKDCVPDSEEISSAEASDLLDLAKDI